MAETTDTVHATEDQTITKETIEHLLSCGECQKALPVMYQLCFDSSEVPAGTIFDTPQNEYDDEGNLIESDNP